MNEIRRRWMQNEFDRIWESLEPEIREDADRLDYRLRVVWSEAVACGVGGGSCGTKDAGETHQVNPRDRRGNR